jgi:hypothetical protein
MATKGEIRWLERQPLNVQLAGVERVWRFATARIQDIAGNAVLTTAVVSHISAGVGEDMDVMALLRVCQRLGVNL